LKLPIHMDPIAMAEMDVRTQQSIDDKHEFYRNTRDIRQAPKRIRYLKRKHEADKSAL
jgi:hypothetical protein